MASAWVPGEEVATQYGRGVVREARKDGIVHVTVTSWDLANGAKPQLFLNGAALSETPLEVGCEVKTQYGRGILEEVRAEDGAHVVRLETWKLAGESRPRLYLRPEGLSKAKPRTMEQLNVEEKLERVSILRDQGKAAYKESRVAQAVDAFKECLLILQSLQAKGVDELGVTQKARSLGAWIPVCLMMARCAFKQEYWKIASQHAKNALELAAALQENCDMPVFRALLRMEEGMERSTPLVRWPATASVVMARSMMKTKNFSAAADAAKKGLGLDLSGEDFKAIKEELSKLLKRAAARMKEQRKSERKIAQRMFSMPSEGENASSANGTGAVNGVATNAVAGAAEASNGAAVAPTSAKKKGKAATRKRARKAQPDRSWQTALAVAGVGLAVGIAGYFAVRKLRRS